MSAIKKEAAEPSNSQNEATAEQEAALQEMIEQNGLSWVVSYLKDYCELQAEYAASSQFFADQRNYVAGAVSLGKALETITKLQIG